MNSKQFVKPTIIATAVAAAFFIGQRTHGVTGATAAAAVTSPVVSTAARGAQALPDFSPLVEANGAAVVNIAVTKRAAVTPAQFDEDSAMGEMLRRLASRVPRARAVRGVAKGAASARVSS